MNINPRGIMYDIHEEMNMAGQVTRTIFIRTTFEYPNTYLEAIGEKEPTFLGGR